MPRRLKVNFIFYILCTLAGLLVGFGLALFLQALGQASQEEQVRKEYLTPDPWAVGLDEYDKFKDDKNTN
jgi:hypothetical protein